MRLLLYLIITFLVLACNNKTEQQEPFKSLLQKCDTVNFKFYNDGDTLYFNTGDSLGIKYLTQAVMGNSETINDTCKPSGELYYRAKNDTLLRTEFAVLPSLERKDCAYMSYTYEGKSYKNRLPEKVHQLLVQMYPKPPVDSVDQKLDSTIMDSAKKPLDSAKK